VGHAEEPRQEEAKEAAAYQDDAGRVARAARRISRQVWPRPGPNDPLLFDPDKDEPTPIGEARLDAEMLEAMRKTGVAPQIIYAYRKTGRLLLEGGRDLYPPEAQAAWDAAIDEYFRLEAQAEREPPSPRKEVTKPRSAERAEFDAQSRYYHDNPAFKGILEFDLTIGWLGKQITRRARVDYEHTPEGEFYDLQKKELVVSIVDQCMYSLHLQAVPEEFHDDGTITPRQAPLGEDGGHHPQRCCVSRDVGRGP